MASAAADDVRIRRTEPGDYVGVAATMSTPRAIAGTLQLPFPSLEVWRERVARSSEPETFSIVAEARVEPGSERFRIVGNLTLHLTPMSRSLRRRHVADLGMSVHDDWQGRGIGSLMMRTALDQADNWMNVLRIELMVFADNAPAIALYRRHGFVVEGTHRAHALRDGAYIDSLSMARLHPRPPVLPSSVVD